MSELRDIHAALDALNRSQTALEKHVSDSAAYAEINAETTRQLLEAVKTLTDEVVSLRTSFNTWLDSEAEQKLRIRSRLEALENAKR